MNKPEISVIIPTYNRADDLERCLIALSRQTFRNFETIIVNNGCTDRTEAMLTKYPVRVVKDFARNVTHLFNVGWNNAATDIVAFTNDDAEPDPSWLKNISLAFARHKDAAAIGGPTVLPTDKQGNQEMLRLHDKGRRSLLYGIASRLYESIVLEGKYGAIGLLFESGAYSVGGSLPESANLPSPISVDLLSITNVAIKRHILDELGGLDESFKFTHGDGDLFVRIRQAGHQLIFDPKVFVRHHVNPTGDTRGAYWRGRDYAYFLRKRIRPKNTVNKLRLAANVICFNLYWIYKSIETKDMGFLRGISGFWKGMRERIPIQTNIRYDDFNQLIFSMVKPESRVLDIGAATGRLAGNLKARKKCYVAAVEIDNNMSRQARVRCDELVCGDIESIELPFAKKSFDTVIFADVLEHLRDPAKVLRKSREYLKDGGNVLISIPNIGFISVRLQLLLGKFDYSEYGPLDKTHLRFFTLKTAKELIEDCGYRIVHSEGYNQVKARYFFLRPLGKIFKTLFATDFIIKAVIK